MTTCPWLSAPVTVLYRDDVVFHVHHSDVVPLAYAEEKKYRRAKEKAETARRRVGGNYLIHE